MNKIVTLVAVLFIITMNLSAQLSEGGTPESQLIPGLKSTVKLPYYKLKSFNKKDLLEYDKNHPIPFRYAIFEDVNIDLKSAGRKDTIPGKGGFFWRLKIESDSAYSIQLILRKFFIPRGARLFVYNEQLTQLLGAFTANNMQEDSSLVISDIAGNKAVIEYDEPGDVDFAGEIVIGSIAKAYRNIYQLQSGSAYININCPEGRDLQLAKHAVCKISFRSDSGSYLCSGSLINNVRQNEIPYFLTASHCISTSAEAATLVAYFNYENPDCGGSTILTTRSLTGASLLSTSPTSDYTLLQLNNKPTIAYQPYYAGWDAHDVRTDHVSGIHHPEGLTKKLSIDNDTTVANTAVIQWQGSSSSPIASHWQVNFDLGLTAGGSSGSPLFNKNKQIIGQLHGGDNTYDFYGKFSYSWIHTSGKFPGLKTFLDPDSTGAMSLGGHYPAGTPPDAFIDVPVSSVCVQAPVKLTDYSVFAPYTRKWTISPSTYTFVNGTTNSSPNPEIEFLQAGTYSIKLNITNSGGVDSMKINSAFQAGTTIHVGISTLSDGGSCFYNFNHFTAWAQGANTYQWSVLPGSQDKITLNKNTGDTVQVSLVPGFFSDSSFVVRIGLSGTQGTCTDTTSLTYNLIKQANDSIHDAYLISYGTSRIYSNKCATIEPGEPVPPHYSCTTQYSWCDEYGTGLNIVEHSVWFKFVAQPGGFISISSSGFDNELALYDANSYQDILNGVYTILAANDDRSTTDFNPLIRSARVTAGKTYWIQVDGSGGGMEGNFILQLTALSVTGVSPDHADQFSVYPQPANDLVYIKGDALTAEPVHVSVYSSVGTLVDDETVYPTENILTLNVRSWEKGIYVVKMDAGTNQYVTRIVKF
jgi:V8-like Glu-specific endopeptidase